MTDFYDELAPLYQLIFSDWDTASIAGKFSGIRRELLRR